MVNEEKMENIRNQQLTSMLFFRFCWFVSWVAHVLMCMVTVGAGHSERENMAENIREHTVKIVSVASLKYRHF